MKKIDSKKKIFKKSKNNTTKLDKRLNNNKLNVSTHKNLNNKNNIVNNMHKYSENNKSTSQYSCVTVKAEQKFLFLYTYLSKFSDKNIVIYFSTLNEVNVIYKYK